jgi:hypothetical protein
MSRNEDAQGKGDQVVEPDVVAALRQIIKDRRLTKEFVETDEFGSIFEGLRETIMKGRPWEVWSGLSIAGRAASVSKPMENGPVTNLCRSKCSFKPPSVQK